MLIHSTFYHMQLTMHVALYAAAGTPERVGGLGESAIPADPITQAPGHASDGQPITDKVSVAVKVWMR